MQFNQYSKVYFLCEIHSFICSLDYILFVKLFKNKTFSWFYTFFELHSPGCQQHIYLKEFPHMLSIYWLLFFLILSAVQLIYKQKIWPTVKPSSTTQHIGETALSTLKPWSCGSQSCSKPSNSTIMPSHISSCVDGVVPFYIS